MARSATLEVFAFNKEWTTEQMKGFLAKVKNPLMYSEVMRSVASTHSLHMINYEGEKYIVMSSLFRLFDAQLNFASQGKHLMHGIHYVHRFELNINHKEFGGELSKQLSQPETKLLTMRGVLNCLIHMRGGKGSAAGQETLEKFRTWIELCMVKLEEIAKLHSTKIEHEYMKAMAMMEEDSEKIIKQAKISIGWETAYTNLRAYCETIGISEEILAGFDPIGLSEIKRENGGFVVDYSDIYQDGTCGIEEIDGRDISDSSDDDCQKAKDLGISDYYEDNKFSDDSSED